jgi:hypothetical protein
MNNFTLPSGIRSCHNRVVQERPQSNTSLSAPASTSVLGPKRSGRGLGVPVPRSVTLKLNGAAGGAVEVCAKPDAASAIKHEMVRTTGFIAYLSAISALWERPVCREREGNCSAWEGAVNAIVTGLP